MTCETILDHAAGFLDGSLSRLDRDAFVVHLETCAGCRALVAALEAADDPGLSDAILARTSGVACESARSRLCDRVDGALGSFDAELVDAHLLHCSECGALATALRGLQQDLPRLAAVDPGAGFVEAVLARTSRRPRRVPLSERCAAAVSRLLDRPRIALEGAFVVAVVIGLPLAAFPASTPGRPAAALTDARGAMSDLEVAVHIEARSAWAKARAFVVVTSARVRQGTLERLGASSPGGDANAPEERR